MEKSGVADADTRVIEGVDGVVTFDIMATVANTQVFSHQSIKTDSLHICLLCVKDINIQLDYKNLMNLQIW